MANQPGRETGRIACCGNADVFWIDKIVKFVYCSFPVGVF